MTYDEWRNMEDRLEDTYDHHGHHPLLTLTTHVNPEGETWRREYFQRREAEPHEPVIRSIESQIDLREGRPDRWATAPAIPQVTAAGKWFWRDGQPWFCLQCSEFRAYERFLRGWDIRPVLQERQDIGFECLRVWLLNTSVGHILPWEHGRFYEQLPAFVELCARYGHTLEFTVFTQTETLMPDLKNQQVHWNATITALNETPCMVSRVNEGDQHDNDTHPALVLWRPDNSKILLSNGSNGADSEPPAPIGRANYIEYHTNDLPEWWRKVGHNTMEWADHFNVAGHAGENTRPDKDPTPRHFEDAGKGAKLLCAAACFHSNSGKDSVPFNALDMRCADAFVRGVRSVPIEFRTGMYRRHDDELTPDLLRVYSRTLPDGRQFKVRIRR